MTSERISPQRPTFSCRTLLTILAVAWSTVLGIVSPGLAQQTESRIIGQLLIRADAACPASPST